MYTWDDNKKIVICSTRDGAHNCYNLNCGRKAQYLKNIAFFNRVNVMNLFIWT